MTAFRYQAVEAGGSSVQGVIEAPDRRAALELLGNRNIFPSNLEICANGGPKTGATLASAPGQKFEFRLGSGVKRKEITAFTRELGALLGAGIPIPQALEGLGEEGGKPGVAPCRHGHFGVRPQRHFALRGAGGTSGLVWESLREHGARR